MAVQDYRDLIVWQKGIELVEAVYRATSCFPREELYGLTSQIRRAAISVPSNIAGGQARCSLVELTTEVGRLLSGLANSLKRRKS